MSKTEKELFIQKRPEGGAPSQTPPPLPTLSPRNCQIDLTKPDLKRNIPIPWLQEKQKNPRELEAKTREILDDAHSNFDKHLKQVGIREPPIIEARETITKTAGNYKTQSLRPPSSVDATWKGRFNSHAIRQDYIIPATAQHGGRIHTVLKRIRGGDLKICPLCGRKFTQGTKNKPGLKICVADLDDCQPQILACSCSGKECDRFQRTAKTNQVYCPFCKYDADKLFDGYKRCDFKGQNNLNSRKLEQTRIYQSQHDRLSTIQSDEIDYGSGLDGDDQPYSMADLSDENFDEAKPFKGRGSTLPEIKNSINNGGRFIRARETKLFKDIGKTFFVGPKSKPYEIKRAHPPENRKGKLKKGCVKKWKFKGPKEVYPPITRPSLEENEELGLYLPPPVGAESYRGRFLGDTSQASRESGEPGQDMKLFHHQGDSYFKYIYFSDTRPFFYLGLGHDNGKQFQGFLKLLKQGGEWGPCFINLREFKPIPRGRLVSVSNDPDWKKPEPKGDKKHYRGKWDHRGDRPKYELVSHWKAFQPPEKIRSDAVDNSPQLKDILKPRPGIRKIDYARFRSKIPRPKHWETDNLKDAWIDYFITFNYAETTPHDVYDENHKPAEYQDPPSYGTHQPFNYHFWPGLEYEQPKVKGFKTNWVKLPGSQIGGVRNKKGFKVPEYQHPERIPDEEEKGPWYPVKDTTREGLSREWKTKRWRVRDWESLAGNS